MKLIKKTVEMNPETFVPEMEVTLRLSLETLTDSIATGESVYENLGKELVSLLEKQAE